MAGDVITVTHRYAASAERVFDAFLDPAKAAQFLFATDDGTMVRAEIDAHVGGAFNFTDRRDNEDIVHVGRYLVIDRPWRLSFTFAVPQYSAQETTVTIEIVREGAGCALTLTHEGVLPAWAERTQEGWGRILAGLEPVVAA